MKIHNKIMIVEDHPAYRAGLKQVIQGIKNLDLVGTAENGKVFLELLKKTTPDIVLMDIVMPEMDGLEAVDIALEMYPDLKIIIISGHSEEEYLNIIIHKKISGFIHKSARVNEIEKAIQMVIDGNQFYSEELIQLLKIKHLKIDSDEMPKLTERELQILRLLCKGISITGIANELMLSSRTVEVYNAKILHKTGQSNTINLIVYALQHKLISEDDIHND
jgi:DNA-binding NarL/FixJ family response regulator